ncbi:Reverse transcriptase (RNA-dependent DNA polymerase) [Burkholderia pseudomallei]|nr:Reverse transcriptase (RNA-dependent DNA polymerase) [Burkholderia pseudomallei]
MRETIEIDKGDWERILHSELLPYEAPLIFNNDKLYHFAKQCGTDNVPELVRELMMRNTGHSIPFEFRIRRGVSGWRTVAVIHPALQLRFVELYKDYHQLILSLCGKSNYSLRWPFRVASHFIEPGAISVDNSLNDDEADGSDNQNSDGIFASTFFFYSRYTQLYRFIDSPEILELEKRFGRLLKFDVKKCFASIYTHSIAWAVKGKEYAKSQKDLDSFEKRFDKLMQQSNYDETNGIVVGPEVSRIYAEIILQQVDLNIEFHLRKLGITEDMYSIRRYIDDFFVFARDERTLDAIYEVAQVELQVYKLFVNEAKTFRTRRPFATQESIAKGAIQHVLSETLLGWLKEARQTLSKDEMGPLLSRSATIQLSSPYRVSVRIARDLKIAIKSSAVDFSVTTGYALGALMKEVARLRKALDISRLPESELQVLSNLLVVVAETLMFLIAMDFRVRPAIRVAQCMDMLNNMTRSQRELNDSLTERFVVEINALLLSRANEGGCGVEGLNLLIAAKALREDVRLTEQELLDVLQGKHRTSPGFNLEDLSYFDVVTALFYTKGVPGYEALLSALELEVCRRFNQSSLVAISSELCLMFFDFIACPVVSEASKITAIRNVFQRVKNRQPAANEIAHIKSYSLRKIGFVDWDGAANFERILRRKELNAVYDM